MSTFQNSPTFHAVTRLPIADLHCDLLCHLIRKPSHTPYDLSVRCAVPQLKEGNVKLQVMAIFCESKPGSSKSGSDQAEAFISLSRKYAEAFTALKHIDQIDNITDTEKICILPAIENASSFCEETDNLDTALEALTVLQHRMGKVVYISLTWNQENRFGGGIFSKNIGLKEDGKRLVDYLVQQGIALDLSHASDRLADEIFNYVDKRKYVLPILASHSNLRSVTNVPRNLPDEIAKEILRRGGIIGLNFIRSFVGTDSPNNFIKHFEQLLNWGGEQQICFGADFFNEEDLPPAYRTPEGSFFPSYGDAGTYEKVLNLWRSHLKISETVLRNVCYSNLWNFLRTTRTL